MPEAGLTESNVAALADEGRRVELEIPLARLARLEGLLASPEGAVQGQVEFAREGGRIVADVRFAAVPTLQCQRCLGPLPVPLEGGSRVVLLETEEEAAGVPQEFETAMAPHGRLRLASLLEEELLLALPAAPRHAAGQCPAARQKTRDEGAAPDVQRPFANLGELLAGRSKH